MNPSDYTKISFPGLGIEMNPPKYFELFNTGIEINLYGMVIAIGLVLAVIYGLWQMKNYGLNEDQILDGVLIIVPIAVICARLYYCAFEWESYKSDPKSILYIWEGGLAIYGGIIGALLSILVYCKVRKIKVGAVLDLTMLGFLIGQCIGRWGNFFNREAVGDLGNNLNWFLRMGLMHKFTGQYEYFHPAFLYESLWNLAGFLFLHFMSKRRKYDGQIALMYCAWYGFGRAIIEGLRVDSLCAGSFRVSQVLAAVTCVAAVAVLVFMRFKAHDPANLYVNVVGPIEEKPKKKAKKSVAEQIFTEEESDLPAEEITEETAEVAEEPAEAAEPADKTAPTDE